MAAVLSPNASPTAPHAHKHVSKDFVLAGNATFTIEEPNGTHHTYRVRYKEASGQWDETWFVSFLSGPNNEDDYTYLGKLDDFSGQAKTTAKSHALADSYKLRLLNRVLARVWADDHDAYERHGYRTHHEGRCGKCGRKLTVPESIERGIGPECWTNMGGGDYDATPAPAPRSNDDDTVPTDDGPGTPVWNRQVSGPKTYFASDSDCPRFNRDCMEPEYDPQGDEIVAWRGRVNGVEVVIFND